MKKSIGAKTFAMPSPVWVVGTYGENSVPNIMTAAWGGICCSVPPCVTVSLQKPRASYDNIMKRKAFTISIPSSKQAVEADYVGIVSGKNADKFAVTGLTPVKSELVDAPYVGEFPLILECRLVQTVELGIHTQFIGEIVDVKADSDVLDEKGIPTLQKVSPFVFSASDKGYYQMGDKLGEAFSIGMKFKVK
ncbi:flavin reductase family protein [Acetobacterium paludosum]|uniref:Flavin reductase family protein n=1 Tax=Acetobacterium paludosum TaxID=52693 RepID=A0A923KXN5_9FIRM|nr:flavin reductase family protein [Acetobacterium paludosum]MBC3889578.1 flavin reductase family protein [Acetobacterium paludosum]